VPDIQQEFAKGKPIYAGIDVHTRDWVAPVLCEGEESQNEKASRVLMKSQRG